MKLYAPGYYKDFSCIADKCTHSCCIGWEIDIDGNTMEKYASVSHGYGERIRKSIDRTDTPHFCLGAGERCPHLDETGLCRIISNLGEEYLCEICREHPRFYNDTAHGKEVGLGMACEEACRIILESDEYANITEIGTVDGEPLHIDFDAAANRARIYEILGDMSISREDRLLKIESVFDVHPERISDGAWREVLSGLEYLDEADRTLMDHYTSVMTTPPELEKPLTRALAYFIYRHGSGARDAREFREAVGFSLFCERLLASAVNAEHVQDMSDFIRLARIISEEIEYSVENTEAIRLEFSFMMED